MRTVTAVLVIKDGSARLVNVKNQDSITKILDMVPDFINKFKKDKEKEEDVTSKVDEALKSQTYSAD